MSVAFASMFIGRYAGMLVGYGSVVVGLAGMSTKTRQDKTRQGNRRHKDVLGGSNLIPPRPRGSDERSGHGGEEAKHIEGKREDVRVEAQCPKPDLPSAEANRGEGDINKLTISHVEWTTLHDRSSSSNVSERTWRDSEDQTGKKKPEVSLLVKEDEYRRQ